MKKLLLRLFVLVGFLGFSAAIFAHHASAASIVVSGGCSVDNAILSANNDADTGGCAGSGVYGDDEITVPSGTWNIGAAVTSEGNLTIVGAGMNDTFIDGADTYPGLTCSGAGPGLVSLEVSGLTVQNTGSGSGAYPVAAANCNLDVSQVEITDGQEGANIYFYLDIDGVTAQLAIQDTYIHTTRGDGVSIVSSGGTVNQMDVEIDRLTVDSNTAPSQLYGGLNIVAGGDLANAEHTVNVGVRNSTFVDSAMDDSFGISAVAQAPSSSGANNTLQLALENVTIVNHSVSGYPASGLVLAAYVAPGSSGSVNATTKNVLLANNQAASGSQNCVALEVGGGGTESATITSLGNNIADDTTCNLISAGDQQGLANIMSTLGPLQDNGGSIPTMALLTGSPAIDAGAVVAGLTIDQRGVARPQCAAYDVGAYEYDGVCAQEVVATPPSVDQTGSILLADTGENIYFYLMLVALLVGVSFAGLAASRRQ